MSLHSVHTTRLRIASGLLMGLGLFSTLSLLGQDGSVDASFKSPLFKLSMPLISVEADGRVIYATTDDGIHYFLGRLNTDGTQGQAIDIGAGAQSITAAVDVGTFHIPGATNPATIGAIQPLPNGQILVGGSFSHFNKVARKLLVRLNSDGSVDTTFNKADAFQGDNVYSISLGSGGKIFVGGKFSKVGTSSRNVALVRLNEDGSLDPSFVDGTISFGASVTDVTVQPDGKPLFDAAYVGSTFQATVQIYRMGANGGLDAGFAQGVGTPYAPAAPLHHGLMANGQILAAGGTGVYNGVNVNKSLFRINSDGTIDTAYPGVTLGFLNIGGIIGRFLPGPNGSMYFSGAFDKVNGQVRTGLARLKPDGTLDPNFVPAVTATTAPGAVALQADGKILVGSSTLVGLEVKYNIVRLNGSGGAPVQKPQIGGLSLLGGGSFQLQVSGATASVAVEGSSNLGTWLPVVTTAVANGAITFTDPLAVQAKTRFYRFKTVP